MSFLASLSLQDLGKFLNIIQGSTRVRSHMDLFNWLHSDIQSFLSHDILVAAWGDFSLRLIHLDVVSYLPGMRTTEIDREDLLPILVGLFDRWVSYGHTPFSLQINPQTFIPKSDQPNTELENALLKMGAALVHGIKDKRGRHDCLYVALSLSPVINERAALAMEVLLPYVDTALRQVAHLPEQFPEACKGGVVECDLLPNQEIVMEYAPACGLTQRERDIMHWVSLGKTNPEIGSILNISSYTVKNHLQRIFRKLDVINRAQAVAQFDRPTSKIDA